MLSSLEDARGGAVPFFRPLRELFPALEKELGVPAKDLAEVLHVLVAGGDIITWVKGVPLTPNEYPSPLIMVRIFGDGSVPEEKPLPDYPRDIEFDAGRYHIAITPDDEVYWREKIAQIRPSVTTQSVAQKPRKQRRDGEKNKQAVAKAIAIAKEKNPDILGGYIKNDGSINAAGLARHLHGLGHYWPDTDKVSPVDVGRVAIVIRKLYPKKVTLK